MHAETINVRSRKFHVHNLNSSYKKTSRSVLHTAHLGMLPAKRDLVCTWKEFSSTWGILEYMPEICRASMHAESVHIKTENVGMAVLWALVKQYMLQYCTK